MPKASEKEMKERTARIIQSILERGKRPKEIAKETGLNYRTMMRYLEKLMKRGIVEKALDENGRVIYRLAKQWEKDKEFLRLYYEIQKDKINVVKRAKRFGLFTKGIDEKKIIKALGWDIDKDLTLYELISFLGCLAEILGPYKIVKIKLKLKELDKKTLEKLRKMEKLFDEFIKKGGKL